MAKQVKIVVTASAAWSPFESVEIGKVYDAQLLQPGEYDADGDEVDEPSVAFTDDVGDLCVAHIHRHQGKRFDFA